MCSSRRRYSRGFRSGGINDPLNVGLCSAADLVTYCGHENWEDENVTNYEIGTKTRLADGRVTFNASVFMTEIDGLQVIADAGTCSSRIILNADAETTGRGVRVVRAARTRLGLRPLGDLRQGGNHRVVQLASGTGRRHPRRQSSADLARAAGCGDRRVQLGDERVASRAIVRFTVQYVGSSFTQLADQEPNFGLISNSATRPPGSARLIDLGARDIRPDTNIRTSMPELPSYEIGNLRWGFSTDAGKPRVFVNNLWDERRSCPSTASAAAARVWVTSPTRRAPTASTSA